MRSCPRPARYPAKPVAMGTSISFAQSKRSLRTATSTVVPTMVSAKAASQRTPRSCARAPLALLIATCPSVTDLFLAISRTVEICSLLRRVSSSGGTTSGESGFGPTWMDVCWKPGGGKASCAGLFGSGSGFATRIGSGSLSGRKDAIQGAGDDLRRPLGDDLIAVALSLLGRHCVHAIGTQVGAVFWPPTPAGVCSSKLGHLLLQRSNRGGMPRLARGWRHQRFDHKPAPGIQPSLDLVHVSKVDPCRHEVNNAPVLTALTSKTLGSPASFPFTN